MPKKAKEMSAVEVKRLKHGTVTGKGLIQKREDVKLKPAGTPCVAYHAVGGVAGLLLCCKPQTENQKREYKPGARSWILRTKVGNKRRDIGLGGYPDVTLSQARDKARGVKEAIRQGIDPVAEKAAIRSTLIAEQAKAITFEKLAEKYIKKKSKEFKSDKQRYKLQQQLETYAYPVIGRLSIPDIGRAHIVSMLEPIWETKNETATRVRLHVERILDLAGVQELRSGDNPARWKGNLDLTFAAAHKVAKRQHHNALPVDDLPVFWGDLTARNTVGAMALQFAILTAARPGEARAARWIDIDLEKRLWTIPSEKMKGGKEHKVPLSPTAITLVKSLPRNHDCLFPGSKGTPISDVMMSRVPKQLGHNVTAHGFRSTFRTWTQEHTNYPEEVCELALAHVNSDATRAAYARSELIDKRRLLMNDWEHFILNGPDERGKVVKFA